MLPSIERVTVSAFDLHLWPRPLTDRTSLRQPMHMLCNPAAYRAARIAGTTAELPGFWVIPLSEELRADRNHFWPRYGEAAQLSSPGPGYGYGEGEAEAGPGDWLLPLRCRPRQAVPRFALSSPAINLSAHATIWLWPFGWASGIEFGVRASPGALLTVDVVQAITASLRAGAAPPFEMAGQRKALSDVFRELGGRLRENLAVAGQVAEGVLKVPRRLVVSAILTQGAPASSYLDSFAGATRFSDSERGRILGILAGVDMPAVKAVSWESSKAVQLTALPRGSFALSKSDLGTLLVLRHPADTGSRRDRYRCLFANVRACWVTAAALGNLVKHYSGLGDDGHDRARLVAAAAGALGRLPLHYTNRLCQVIVGHQQ
jgi:hypothetical protein